MVINWQFHEQMIRRWNKKQEEDNLSSDAKRFMREIEKKQSQSLLGGGAMGGLGTTDSILLHRIETGLEVKE